MIALSKQYTTAFNDEVKLYEIVDNTVFGRIKIGNTHHPIQWNIDGINNNPDYNLIPLPAFEIIKLTTKTINYFGQQFNVPINDKYIATNQDGEIYTYEKKPCKYNTMFVERGHYFAKCKFIGDWEQSLIEI